MLSDTFCEGKYESLWLDRQDFENIDDIRKNKKYKITVDKLIDHVTINEKEFDFCKKP